MVFRRIARGTLEFVGILVIQVDLCETTIPPVSRASTARYADYLLLKCNTDEVQVLNLRAMYYAFNFLGAYWFRLKTYNQELMPRMIRWPRYQLESNKQANTNMAPSVAEADAILARFGYKEQAVAELV